MPDRAAIVLVDQLEYCHDNLLWQIHRTFQENSSEASRNLPNLLQFVEIGENRSTNQWLVSSQNNMRQTPVESSIALRRCWSERTGCDPDVLSSSIKAKPKLMSTSWISFAIRWLWFPCTRIWLGCRFRWRTCALWHRATISSNRRVKVMASWKVIVDRCWFTKLSKVISEVISVMIHIGAVASRVLSSTLLR